MSRILRRPLLIGVLAGGGLLAVYMTVVTVGQGFDGALAQLRNDAPLLLPIFPLFGTQVGLFAHLKERVAQRMTAISAATGASGGVSGTAVVACCAHLIPTFLPAVGASAFATALAAVRTPLLLAAILANLVGVSLVVRALARWRGQSASVESPGPEVGT